MSVNHPSANRYPLDVLAEIKSAVLQNASDLPHNEESQAPWQGIGFSLGGARLVAQMGQVDELLKLPKLTKLPGVQSWVLGVANIRGRLLPIIDLHQFLKLPATVPSNQWRVLVVEHEDVVAGLLVEQSLGIQYFSEDVFEVGLGQELEGIGPYVKGAFRHSGRLYHAIDLGAILSDEKFFAVAAEQSEADWTFNEFV